MVRLKCVRVAYIIWFMEQKRRGCASIRKHAIHNYSAIELGVNPPLKLLTDTKVDEGKV